MSVSLLAIDPGAEHCGWCLAWAPGAPTVAGVLPPNDMYDFVAAACAIPDRPEAVPTLMVIEEYRVIQDSANRYGTLATVEVIGVLKYLARGFGMTVVMQEPAIKKPIKGWMLGHGIGSVVPRNLGERRVHAADAELHAWYRIRRLQEGES